jgi:hypothetical protein
MGATFIVFGRWLYRNPTRMFPGRGILNPQNPRVKKMARAYATFAIFFGTLVLAAGLLRGPYVVLLALPIAIAGAWFLRPRLQEPGLVEAVVQSPIDGTPKQGWLSKHWRRNLAIALGIAILFSIGIIGMIGNSEVSRLAFSKAEADPIVRQRLGEPVKRGFFTSGNIEVSDSSGRADLSIPISGPKGTATLYAVAGKTAGLWEFGTLEVQFKDDAERLNLLNRTKEPVQ